MSECPTSRVLDYIAKLKREHPRDWFLVEFGRYPKDDAELQAALAASPDALRPTLGK